MNIINWKQTITFIVIQTVIMVLVSALHIYFLNKEDWLLAIVTFAPGPFLSLAGLILIFLPVWDYDRCKEEEDVDVLKTGAALFALTGIFTIILVLFVQFYGASRSFFPLGTYGFLIFFAGAAGMFSIAMHIGNLFDSKERRRS